MLRQVAHAGPSDGPGYTLLGSGQSLGGKHLGKVVGAKAATDGSEHWLCAKNDNEWELVAVGDDQQETNGH